MKNNYMTKITVLEDKVRRGFFSDDYGIHKFVYAIFSGDERIKFSYNLKDGGDLIILAYHSCEAQPMEGVTIMTKELSFPKLGSQIAFRLDGNPSVNKARSNKRYIPASDEAKEQWLLSKDLGLEIHSVEFEQVDCRTGKGICIPLYRYSGRAIVKDAEKLQQAMITGVGRGKAFGAGMLLIQLLGA